ncbi:LysM peptidoglycan-binding domain-containing protein [Winogradskyella schleiferi]|uniref:LysM peptidoglycan-binding domain-containing protein n=1 Tax=Winogradskyella schleiferi TaxID=2686078 RepID=UPI0015B9D732|nr:LysM peptidoglycan-binding domain-containing protein [Winogradskyella schleiferi]
MPKSFNLIVAFLIYLTVGTVAYAQDQGEFKNVLLDGKPAKLNVVTGEITLVTIKDKVVETKIDTVNTKPLLVTDASVIGSSVSEVDTTSDFHVVEDGETLLDISRTYKVTLSELKQANNLETTLVNAGQKLRIKNFDTETNSISSNGSNFVATNSNFHSVEKGNTLFSLSRRYNLSVEELKRLNNLNSNIIKIGQKLRVNDFQTSRDDKSLTIYVVKKGDNLYRIALENGTTIDAIKKLNGLKSNIINIGQKLKLK